MLILLVDFLYFPGWWAWWESREGASSLGVWASVVTGGGQESPHWEGKSR